MVQRAHDCTGSFQAHCHALDFLHVMGVKLTIVKRLTRHFAVQHLQIIFGVWSKNCTCSLAFLQHSKDTCATQQSLSMRMKDIAVVVACGDSN